MDVKEIIEKILNGEYIISEDDLIKHPELRKNFEVMKKAIDIDCNFVRYAEIRCYDRNDIGEYAVERGFIPTYADMTDNRYLRISSSLKKLYQSNLNKLLLEIKSGNHFVTKEDLLIYEELRRDFEIMLSAVEHNCNLMPYASLGSFNKTDREMIVNKALESGYIPNKQDFILSGKIVMGNGIIPYNLGKSDALMLAAIKIDPNLVCFNINYVDYAFENGLQINKELLDEWPNLLLNDKIFKLSLDIDPNYMENAFLKKGDGSSQFENFNSTLTVDNLKYAIKNGYIPTPELVKKISSKNIRIKEIGNINALIKELLLICIEINPDSLNGYDREIDEEIIQYAINKGYVPHFDIVKNNPYLMDSYIIGNYFLKQKEEWQNNKFLKQYIEKYSSKRLSANIIMKIWPFISKEDIYKFFSFDEILNIVQYIYLSFEKAYNMFNGKYTGRDKSNYSELHQNLEKIIDNGDLKQFISLVNLFSSNYPTKEKIDIMQQISRGFIIYKKMIDDIFTKENITQEDLYILKQLLISDEIVNVNELNDLKQYSKLLFEKRKKYINSIDEEDEYDEYYWDDELDDSVFLMLYESDYGEMEVEENEGFLLLQDQILKMLCNISLIDYLSLINYDFNSKRIEKLISCSNDEPEKEKLENYKSIIEFIESILKCRDFNNLKDIANKLNEGLYNNNDCILPIYESFNRLIIEKRSFFGNELSQNLTNIQKLTSQKDENKSEKKYIRENKKFLASNRELYGEKLEGKAVDYIELQGTDFVFLTHVLNAYGDGAELLDFKYPRLLGRPHICLSAVGDNCLEMATSKIDKLLGGNTNDDYTDNYSPERINYVTLLFDKVDKNQLAVMSYSDLGSFSIQNSLNIESNRMPEFLTTHDLLKNTNDYSYYNECVFYRRDENGNYIYPSAIIVRNNVPTQYEIDAAAYLDVPIVYINKNYYLKNTKDQKTIIEHKNDNASGLKDQLQELKKLLEISALDKKGRKK